MFFRRGRLRTGQARSRLRHLFNAQYQWWLRTPVRNWLARDDLVCFTCSLVRMMDDVGRGLYLLNRRQPPEVSGGVGDDVPPWYGSDLGQVIEDFSLYPQDLVERWQGLMRLDDPARSEVEGRRLLCDLIDLFLSQEKKQDESPLPWYDQVPQPQVEGLDPLEPDLGRTMSLARQAVRIVWRLPGGHMSALTGSVAAGWADRTSDVDIVVYGDHLADETVRRSLIGATSDSDQDVSTLTYKRQARDRFWLDGRLIDVRYFLLEDVKRLVEYPVTRSPQDKEILAQVDNLESLYDPTFLMVNVLAPKDLERAAKRAREERLGLAGARLDQALSRLSDSGQPDPTLLYGTVTVILGLFNLLAARNDRWLAFPRWTANWLDQLGVAPAETHARLTDVVTTPFRPNYAAAKVKALRALVAEARAL